LSQSLVRIQLPLSPASQRPHALVRPSLFASGFFSGSSRHLAAQKRDRPPSLRSSRPISSPCPPAPRPSHHSRLSSDIPPLITLSTLNTAAANFTTPSDFHTYLPIDSSPISSLRALRPSRTMPNSDVARQWFVPGDGIDRHVIVTDIQRYLGNDATVRPGKGTGENNVGLACHRCPLRRAYHVPGRHRLLDQGVP